MSDHYLDTSGLVKHYHLEPGTPKVDLLWANQRARLFISRLTIVEAVSAFATKVRTGQWIRRWVESWHGPLSNRRVANRRSHHRVAGRQGKGI